MLLYFYGVVDSSRSFSIVTLDVHIIGKSWWHGIDDVDEAPVTNSAFKTKHGCVRTRAEPEDLELSLIFHSESRVFADSSRQEQI